jgi:methylglutaconyl-CoA hydratase
MSLVCIEDSDSAAVITLNRPEKRNALSRELVAALHEAVTRAADDPCVRAIVVTGAGPVFCAGLDLAEVAAEFNDAAADPEKDTSNLMALFQALHACGKPTIAAVNGAAVAGGAGLMSACDYVLVADDATVGYPEVKRGLTAAIVMVYLLRQVGDRQARRLLLGGEMIDAAEAWRIGLVNEVVAPDALLFRAETLAGELATGAPGALAATKTLLDELQNRPIDDDLKKAVEWHLKIRLSDESREGIEAFFEKRKPNWLP